MCCKLCHLIWGIWWFHRSRDFEAMKAGKLAIGPRLSCQYSENSLMDLLSSMHVSFSLSNNWESSYIAFEDFASYDLLQNMKMDNEKWSSIIVFIHFVKLNSIPCSLFLDREEYLSQLLSLEMSKIHVLDLSNSNL